MLKVIIVDDEPASLEYLKMLINANASLTCIGAFTQAMEAYEFLKSHNPDVIFLDIEMPVLTGTDLAYQIKLANPAIQIVFITAFSQYAVDAFKINALHYLLKPIAEEDLEEVVSRLLGIKELPTQQNIKWRIEIMGGFKVYNALSKSELYWPTKKAEELFAYFIYQRHEIIEKSKLWDLLWPELDERRAQHNLHNTIYRIKELFKKKMLEPHIEYKNNGYQFFVDDFECDAFEFQEFMNKKLEINDENLSCFEKYFTLYKGVLFENKDYEWAYGWHLSLLNYYSTMVKQLARFYLDKAQYEAAESKVLRLLALQPWDEDAHELLLNIYFQSGERMKLTNAYQNLVRILKKEMNLEPRASTKQIFINALERV